MELLILDAGLERADTRGRRRVFVRVAIWYGERKSGTVADATVSLLVHVPTETVSYIERPSVRFGSFVTERKTKSGRWLEIINSFTDINGDWMIEDPDDPWAVETSPLDFNEQFWKRVDAAAADYRNIGFRGDDGFRAEDSPDLDAAPPKAQAEHRARIRAMVGKNHIAAPALPPPSFTPISEQP